jgi:exonuclease SbcC
MIPRHLYIENFRCFDKSHIDFDKFNSALIVGVRNNNSDVSNGAGKTSIFLALEYCIFNEYPLNMERMIRDGCKSTKIIFDFELDSVIYRIVRTRAKNGTADVSFFSTTEIVDFQLHESKKWKDLSGRRSSDTEKEIKKVIKISYTSFRSTSHFVQRDMSGLSTASPTDRKKILKSALDLSVYSILEKNAKDQYNNYQKNLSNKQAVLSSIGNPEDLINENNIHLDIHSREKKRISNEISYLQESINPLETQKSKLLLSLNSFESKFSTLNSRKLSIQRDILKLSTNSDKTKENAKKLVLEAKDLITKNKIANESLSSYYLLDLSEYKKDLKQLKENETNNISNIKTYENKILQLKSPLPKDDVCNHCKQKITEDYRKEHNKEVLENISKLEKDIENYKLELTKIKSRIKEIENIIEDQAKISSKIDSINHEIAFRQKEIDYRRQLHSSSKEEIESIEQSLKSKEQENIDVEEQLAQIDFSTQELLKSQISELSSQINDFKTALKAEQASLSSIDQSLAICNHQKTKFENDIIRKNNLIKDISDLEKEYEIYPEIINAFSSTGIPNIIIQSILDDLELEVNEILNSFVPGLQLRFVVEKEQKDKTLSDTLDIIYSLDNKERLFGELSGAQQLSASFALKLGLSGFLQRIMGFKINFILLDECDDALDRASIDAFANVVRKLEESYKVLIITHNEHAKEKFTNHLIVEQDIERISRVKQ